MTSRRPVVIDTDPGLDDAVALLFAVASGAFDVRGITTVAGNIGIGTTTRNAGRLLAALGRSDIPVVRGAAGPLRREAIDETAIHGADGLGGVDLPDPAAPAFDGAADWLAHRLGAAPAGSIDVLALGPLTNLARLVIDHPEAARRIGRVIAMGGAIGERGNVGPRSEFNLAADPDAADIVLRAGLDLTLIPLDVTRRVRADGTYLDDLRAAGTSAARLTADLLAAYVDKASGRESRPLHDPMVMIAALRPDLFRIETLRLAVDLGAGGDPGALVADADGAVPVSVALGVDAPAALALLADGLAQRPADSSNSTSAVQ